MLIRRPDDLKPSAITDERIWRERRRFVQSVAAGSMLATAPALAATAARAAAADHEPIEDFGSGPFSTDEDKTPFDKVTSYNNFYEFGTAKSDPSRHSDAFQPRPWSIEVTGLCDRPGTYDLEDFVAPHRLEERVYRLRCVEAWSMVIPWVGVPLAPVLERFAPRSGARYVAFETVVRPEEMPGQRRAILDWPYVEGLRLDEAMSPLTFLAVGLYGRVIPNQNGAPMRLVVPWKYGFKSIKSIVKVAFVEKMPPTTWNQQAPREYGFYSNVNPNVDHPRWSQRSEKRITDSFFPTRLETRMFNGYGEQVAHLYQGMDLRKHH